MRPEEDVLTETVVLKHHVNILRRYGVVVRKRVGRHDECYLERYRLGCVLSVRAKDFDITLVFRAGAECAYLNDVDLFTLGSEERDRQFLCFLHNNLKAWLERNGWAPLNFTNSFYGKRYHLFDKKVAERLLAKLKCVLEVTS